MNVIGYVRVSTSGQAKDGYSLAYQQDEIRSHCQEQGWNLITIYSDEGISGSKVDEEALEVNSIFHILAVQQIQVAKGKNKKQRNPLMYEFYQRKLAEGKTKKQALICFMRRLVNIIYSMMKNKTEYRAASPLTELKAS